MHNFTKPDYYLEQWELMNEEFVQESTPLSINIPTIEEVNKWLNNAIPNQATAESRKLYDEKGSEKDS